MNLVKIVVVGDSCVGKTSLSECYINGKTANYTHMPTIAIEFLCKDVTIDNNKFKLYIWDTAGQERFRAITKSYYKNAVGALVCFRIDNRKTFDSVSTYIEDILMHSAHNIQMVLVGTFLDTNIREISHSEAQTLAGKYGIPYIEVSSTKNINVNESFETLMKMLYRCYNDGSINLQPLKYVEKGHVSLNSTVQNKSYCCNY